MTAEAARAHVGWSLVDLWIAYVALGGVGDPGELQATLSGEPAVRLRDYDVLAQTLNEQLVHIGSDDRLPYLADSGIS